MVLIFFCLFLFFLFFERGGGLGGSPPDIDFSNKTSTLFIIKVKGGGGSGVSPRNNV